MQLSRIIDVGEVSSRLFALGLDTVEIAGALGMREAAVVEALESADAPGELQAGSAPQ